ncbi:helix-turn-helix transcriptional regulator [Aurantimonas sp. 22II-16-19i]|uniref:helix-turn-helix domain-containing protein n=1 Tax=Aurantimonas sp. 22II-16-19i TaxID=1317114 RepID=UPI0009F7C9BC|nr:helix-turn-helix transcriptional regulator [Aurantimonas sp. 22II-16-19i]ORE93943.1 XRE family transcriptional regulator [Aurantimonas sp. 22II-16-19i]
MPKRRSDTAFDAAVGGRIRMHRITRGMSQRDFAHALQITFQQVQKYETGRNEVSASRLHQMANVLGVSVEAFFEDAPTSDYDSGGLAYFVSTKEGRELNSAFVAIPDQSVRRGVVRLVRAIFIEATTLQVCEGGTDTCESKQA